MQGYFKALRYIVSVASIFILLSVVNSFAGNEPKVYSDQDLGTYRNDSDSTDTRPAPRPGSGPKGGSSVQDRQYWCEWGTYYNDRVSKARQELSDAEDRLRAARHDSDLNKVYKGKMGSETSLSSAQTNRDNAESRLRSAERDLSSFESKADSQGVPPGWLRCQ